MKNSNLEKIQPILEKILWCNVITMYALVAIVLIFPSIVLLTWILAITIVVLAIVTIINLIVNGYLFTKEISQHMEDMLNIKK